MAEEVLKNKYSIDDSKLATPKEVSEHISGYGILARAKITSLNM